MGLGEIRMTANTMPRAMAMAMDTMVSSMVSQSPFSRTMVKK